MTQIPDLKNCSFIPQGGRASYFLSEYLINLCYTKKYAHGADERIGRLPFGLVGTFRDHLCKWHMLTNDLEFKEEYPACLNSYQNIEEFSTAVREETVKKISKEWSKATNEKIAASVSYYFDQYTRLIQAAGVLRVFDLCLLRRLKEALQDEEIAILSSGRPSIGMEEEEKLLRLAAGVSKGRMPKAGAEKALQKIYEKYCYWTMGYYDEKPKNFDDYKGALEGFIARNPTALLEQRKKLMQEQAQRRKAIRASLDADMKRIALMAFEAAYLKDYNKYSVNKIIYYAEPLLREAAKRSNYSPEFVKDLVPEEVLALLKGKKPDSKKVKERIKHSVLISYPNQMIILTGKDAARFEKEYIEESRDETTITGRSACRGMAKGIVRVVHSQADFGKLRKGDILVVINTGPDFVPVLHKVSAIIAEEGGITAHVSVISRELGIPCIVGAINATSIFKDGELVEVDAEKGVARKIS